MPELNTAALTAEQQQRNVAVASAAQALRKGGASWVTNNYRAGKIENIIDLAHYIATGVPYSVAHAHEHMESASGIEFIVGGVDESLTGLFNRLVDKSEEMLKRDGDNDKDADDGFEL